jgi:hypothetical protein
MFEASARQRRTDAEVKWAALTDREQRLVRDAAVMGWVQGKMAAEAAVPYVTQIIITVLEAVASFPDLYPTLAGLPQDRS